MKQYLPGLFALVLAVSMSAFTTLAPADEPKSAASLYWFEYDHASGEVGTYLGPGERSAFTISGCNQTLGNDCRRGYTAEQLANPAVPAEGVDDPEDKTDQIQKGL